MKNENIKKLSDALRLSPATVSRAVRHCGGVDSSTRSLVLRNAEEPTTRDGDSIDIYAMLPDLPRYFWEPLGNTLYECLAASERSFKFNLYTRLGDEDAVLHYLKEAERLNAKVLLLSAALTPRVRERIASLARDRLVLLLSEYADLPHTFYIGSDPTEEGKTVGRCWAEHADAAHLPLFLLDCDWHTNARIRTEGFLHAVRERNPQLQFRRIPLSQEVFEQPKLFPSKLAALLAEHTKAIEQLSLYAPIGNLSLPLALGKAGIRERTVCFVQDPEAQDTLYHTVCRQDLSGQAECAVRSALHYLKTGCCPDRKFTFVDSTVE